MSFGCSETHFHVWGDASRMWTQVGALAGGDELPAPPGEAEGGEHPRESGLSKGHGISFAEHATKVRRGLSCSCEMHMASSAAFLLITQVIPAQRRWRPYMYGLVK